LSFAFKGKRLCHHKNIGEYSLEVYMIAKPNFEGFELVQLSSTLHLETITPFYLQHELHNSIDNHQASTWKQPHHRKCTQK
jgi:hypothetical protein